MMCTEYSRQAAGKISHTREEQFKLLTARAGALGKKVSTQKFCNSEPTRTLVYAEKIESSFRFSQDTNLHCNGMQLGIQSRDLIFST